MEPSQVAVWWSDEHCLKLSAAAAGVLAQEGLLEIKKLELHRSKEWDTTRHYTEFFTATGQATANLVTTTFTSIGQLFYSPVRGTVNTFWGIPEGEKDGPSLFFCSGGRCRVEEIVSGVG